MSPMPQSSLPPEIRDLPVSERVMLVERIWDSIVEDEGAFELTDAQKAELDRRFPVVRRQASGPGTRVQACEGINVARRYSQTLHIMTPMCRYTGI